MGASQEKKRRREEREEGTEKRLVQEKQRELEKKKNKKRIVIGCVVIAVFAIVVTFFSIPQVYAGREAVNVDGKSISVAEYNYYYYTLYYAYYEQAYSQYGSYYSLAMPSEETLREEVMTTIRSTVRLAQEAEAAGFEATEEMRENYNKTVEETKQQVENSSYKSFKKYLKSMYGNVMTEKTYLDVSWYFYFASRYSDEVYDSYIFSPAELDDYYEEHKESLDVLIYRAFKIDGSAVEDDKETEEDETIDAETAMQNALAIAEEFASKVESEQDFIDLAYEYAEEDTKSTYENESATLNRKSIGDIESAYVEWLMDEERQVGDVGVEMGDSAYYVVYYLGIEENDYQTANIHMLYKMIDYIAPSNYETEEEYNKAREEKIEETKAEVQDLLDKFNSSGGTLEQFEALSDENDERNNRNDGGAVEHVYKYQYVDQINEWLFEQERKPGDVKIFYLENDGVYLIYFDGYAEVYRDYLADTALRDAAYEEWEAELEAGATSNIKFWYKFTA